MSTKSLISIKKQGKVFELSISDLNVAQTYFVKYDIKPTGHAWEQVVSIHCKLHKKDLSEVEFDSESDLFSVFSKSHVAIESLKSIIENLTANPELLNEALERFQIDENDFSASEFVEHLEYNHYKLNSKVKLQFTFEFAEVNQTLEACKAAKLKGFECFYFVAYPPYMFAVNSVELISVAHIQSRLDNLKSFINQYGGVFFHCEVDDGSLLSGFETEWKEFENDT